MGHDHAPGYVPNRHYSQEDWNAVSDNPELTDEQLAQGRPLSETMPALVAAAKRRRGAQKTPTKRQITLRLDERVIDHFKGGGSGWQSRINDVLKKVAGLSS